MKCLCKATCQIRIDGQITFVEADDVIELDELPDNGCFMSLEDDGYAVDFITASREELMSVKWKFSDAAKAIFDAYRVTIRREDGDKKSDVVEAILDARYRAIDTSVVKQN